MFSGTCGARIQYCNTHPINSNETQKYTYINSRAGRKQRRSFRLQKLVCFDRVVETGEQILVLLRIGQTLSGLLVDFAQLRSPNVQHVWDFVGHISSVEWDKCVGQFPVQKHHFFVNLTWRRMQLPVSDWFGLKYPSISPDHPAKTSTGMRCWISPATHRSLPDSVAYRHHLWEKWIFAFSVAHVSVFYSLLILVRIIGIHSIFQVLWEFNSDYPVHRAILPAEKVSYLLVFIRLPILSPCLFYAHFVTFDTIVPNETTTCSAYRHQFSIHDQ